jgi:phenylalanyl-tRNA synthetase beta chain
MKISLNWLQDFVELKEKNLDTVKKVITAATAEIETLETQGGHLEHVVVGRIEKVMPHPNADSLRITMVSDGHETLKVVCGGSNLKEGQKIALAKVGAVVKWHGTEVATIAPTKIRGEESIGMICGADEIGLEELFPKKSEKEIVDLSALEAKVGTPLAKALALDDVIIHIDNPAITHRADLFSHKGFAREFVANKLAVWKKEKPAKLPKVNSAAPIEIKIEKDVAPRYCGVYLTGIQIQDSPEWMKKRLSACGVRPINNLVDITNYVMLELGMPLHAFDLDRIQGRKWNLRKSKKGEKVTSLDEKEHELPEDVIVLDDGHSLIDLCGIMGGVTSGITAKTEKVWLIAPVYNSTLIRRATRALAHSSDASTIYEKGVDPALAETGLTRALQLILELCPSANVASKVIDIQNVKTRETVLALSTEKINSHIGTEIPAKEVERILEALGFELSKTKTGYKVTVPTWRAHNTHHEEDLIEEIARIYGYDQIPFTSPTEVLKPIAPNFKRNLEKDLRNKLAGFGFDEIYTFAFLGADLLKKTMMPVREDMITLANPISGDLSIMRESLLPRTLETIEANLRYQKSFRVFELSRTYFKHDKSFRENTDLIIATVGEDFRELQGIVETLGIQVLPGKSPAPHMHPGRFATLFLRGKTLGHLYEIHPQVEKNFDLKSRVTVAEINVSALHELNLPRNTKYTALPKFPAVTLDISMLIPKKDLAEKYHKAIEKADKTLVSEIRLVDEYAGEKVEAGHRSLTFSVTYQLPDRTLKDEEVQTVHQKVIEHLKNSGAQIR